VGGRGVVDKGDFSFLKKSLVTFVLSLRLLRHFVPRNDIFCYALFGKCDIVELFILHVSQVYHLQYIVQEKFSPTKFIFLSFYVNRRKNSGENTDG
jgi:hypothetical protein